MNTISPNRTASQNQPSIVFFHCGRLPKYLLCAIESARVFNPEARIFLITDQQHALGKLNVETVPIAELPHPQLEAFRSCYQHTSAANEVYERTCFERWFYIDQLISSRDLDRVVYLDSDCLLFADAEALFRQMPEKTLCTSHSGGPACTFIKGQITAFLDLILEKFNDDEFLRLKVDDLRNSQDRGEMANLTDMSLIEIFTNSHPQGYVYPNNLPMGHIDHCINLPDGMQYFDIPHRKRKRKRVYWSQMQGLLIPHFRDAATGSEVPALAIHYQSGAKRLIRRFNLFYGKTYMPQKLRAKVFEWMHGGRGSEYI